VKEVKMKKKTIEILQKIGIVMGIGIIILLTIFTILSWIK